MPAPSCRQLLTAYDEHLWCIAVLGRLRVEGRARRRRPSVYAGLSSVPSRCSVVGALAWLKHALSGLEVHVGLAFGSRCARAVQQPMPVGAGSTVADVTVRPDDLDD
jgi:hypothetical protein